MNTELIPQTTPKKDIDYYLALSYTTILRPPNEDGDVIALIQELPGCITHGSDATDALQNLATLRRLWIED